MIPAIESIENDLAMFFWSNSNLAPSVSSHFRKVHDADIVAAYRQGFCYGVKARERMGFKVGDKVRWTSPCRAGLLEHSGVVIEVVPAGGVPSWKWSCSPRNHESYLVREDDRISIVGVRRFVKRGDTFWPLVKWFKEI